MNTVHTRLPSSTLRKLNPFVTADGFREIHASTPGLSRACIPSSPRFTALLEASRATGGTAPGDAVAHLGDHFIGDAVSLAKLIHSGHVFGLEWRGSRWIPMFQFDIDDLSVKSSAQHVRAAPPSLWAGWRLASWFAEPNVALDLQRPVDLLESSLPAVLAAALTQRDTVAM